MIWIIIVWLELDCKAVCWLCHCSMTKLVGVGGGGAGTACRTPVCVLMNSITYISFSRTQTWWPFVAPDRSCHHYGYFGLTLTLNWNLDFQSNWLLAADHTVGIICKVWSFIIIVVNISSPNTNIFDTRNYIVHFNRHSMKLHLWY